MTIGINLYFVIFRKREMLNSDEGVFKGNDLSSYVGLI